MVKRAFTLLELIVVIIIIGVLATLGFTQYALVVEKSRISEAIVRIGTMRKLAYEYYLKNGSMTNIQDADVGGVSYTCNPANYYYYFFNGVTDTSVNLNAWRCISGGKTPNTSRQYEYYLYFNAATGASNWHCNYRDDLSGCFGLTPSGQ